MGRAEIIGSPSQEAAWDRAFAQRVTEPPERDPSESIHEDPLQEEIRAGMKELFRVQDEKAKELIPLEEKVLRLGVDAYVSYCDRLEGGEDIALAPFIDVLRTMETILDEIPRSRWIMLRSSIARVVRKIDYDAGAREDKASFLAEEIFGERDSLLRGAKEQDPAEIERLKKEVQKEALIFARKLREKVAKEWEKWRKSAHDRQS